MGKGCGPSCLCAHLRQGQSCLRRAGVAGCPWDLGEATPRAGGNGENSGQGPVS